jgi:hypothetical protein
MPTVLPMTRVEAYLAYKAGVISESDLKPSLKTNYYSGLEHWLAYWCGLCNDYPTKDGQPKWYTEEEYYVAYLCGIAPDYPVNCYRRVGAYLRYIISARWDRPEKPLTREEYYLSLMDTSYLPPNDPASIITLDNTAEAPFKDLKIYGDTYQFTTTGKNLLPITADFSVDTNGLIFTGKDGVYTVNGNATSGNSSAVQATTTQYVIQSGDYFHLGNPTTATHLQLSLYFSDGTIFNKAPSSVNRIDSLEDCVGKTVTGIRIYFNAGYDITCDFKPMILNNVSTVTDFEPYTGGLPAPNPDFPMPIKTVTGGQTVTVTGKNLLPPPADFNDTLGTLNISCSKGVWTFSGTSQSGHTQSSKSVIAPYTIQAGDYFHYNNTLVSQRINIALTFTDGTTFASSMNAANKIMSLEDYVGKTISTVKANFNSGYEFNGTAKPMILHNVSTVTDYEPYQSQSYTIDLGATELCKIDGYQDAIYRNVQTSGKNLLNYLTAVPATAQTTTTFVTNGFRSVTTSSGYATKITMPIKASTTYALSWNLSIEAQCSPFVMVYKGTTTSSGRYVSQNATSGAGSLSFTTDSDATDINIWFYNGTPAEGTTVWTDIQLELGPAATGYEPYQNPYYDSDLPEGAWCIHKAIGKVVLDGTEDWVLLERDGHYNYYMENMASNNLYIGSAATYMSNYYTGIPTDNRYADGTFFINTTGRGIFTYDAITTKDLFATWLSTHNTTVYYALATPTNTAITNTTLIAQLDALLEGGSYASQTNITLTAADPNLPGLLQVTVAKYQ